MEEAALGDDEVVVIEGALDLATKTVGEIMVPIEGVYMLVNVINHSSSSATGMEYSRHARTSTRNSGKRSQSDPGL